MKDPGNPPPYNPYPQGAPQGYPVPQTAPVGYPQPPNVQPPQVYVAPVVYPQPGYPQPGNIQVAYTPAAQPAPVNIIHQVGPQPQRLTCPSCNASVGTRVERKTANQGHIWALVLCLVGCWPCCLIPYCMDSCTDVNHYCPNCNAYIGGYKC